MFHVKHWYQKSESGSISPDKHKMRQLRRRFFAFLIGVAYDLEGLAAVARQVFVVFSILL
jgi:hypothetical protein